MNKITLEDVQIEDQVILNALIELLKEDKETVKKIKKIILDNSQIVDIREK